MSEVNTFEPPEITDNDIRWAARLLGLPENAFHGEDGSDPRLDVLKSMEQMDVAACPGSGKTTLLVAKLAILANKWQYRTRGICVLSHTNAARREIETRLGDTAVGRQLLSYPHYIGTIHGFVDKFLALPWLRSLNFPIKMIDTKICEARRWKKIAPRWKHALERRYINESGFRIVDTDFNWVKKNNGEKPFDETKETYKAVRDACEDAAKEGFYCYDDMFIWASDLIDKQPGVLDILRDRFPVLFIDEAQDNNEEQSKLLSRLFMEGSNSVIRQRFGDSNQAIYNFAGDKGATTDPFPNGEIKESIPDSYRFGPTIAKLAEPLAVDPVVGGLKGNGPRTIVPGSSTQEGPHTIFLFEEGSIDKVLSAYAELLISKFSDGELKHGVFTAVGQVHKGTGDDNRPRHVGHYWPNYDAELTKANPQPQTLVQYIRAGQEQAKTTGETYPGAEKTAEGLLRLAGMATGSKPIRQSSRKHLGLLKLLEDHGSALKAYYDLIHYFIVERKPVAEDEWNAKWLEKAKKIGEAITGATLDNPEIDSFLAWSGSSISSASGGRRSHHGNFYHYPMGNPKVHIKVGSIHSVKGQTHTATLVLETFWYGPKHNLEFLKEWLMGTKHGCTEEAARDRIRLKVHYVAMTRPTHLLCLAMKKESVNEDDIAELKEHGWHIEDVDG